jgi:peptide/nickel transport system substrate-binding protein
VDEWRLQLAQAKSGGSLLVGITGGASTENLDPHTIHNPADVARSKQLYEPLGERDSDFRLQPVLAEEMTPNNAGDVWTIRLRDGVEFHNGKTLDADDLIFSLQRVLDPGFANTSSSTISFVNPSGLKKVDKRTVQFELDAPQATFIDQVSTYLFSIVPVDFDPRQPVGTGPFKARSFAPGQQSVFEAFENYWGGRPLVDDLTMIDFSDDMARVNALLSGQVHAIDNVPLGQAPIVRASDALGVLISHTGASRPFCMRTDVPPFNDVRVRQAMRLLIGRQQMIDQALGGYGIVGNDMYGRYDECYADHIPQREQDIDQAKSLLAAAGQSDLRVQLTTAPVAAGIVEASQVLAEQARLAGVTVEIRKLDASSFFADGWLDYQMGVDYWGARSYISQVLLTDVPGAPYNQTHNHDEEFHKLVKAASSELDDDKRCELVQAAMQIEWERGGWIVWSFVDTIDAHSKDIAGFVPHKSGFSLSNYNFRNVHFV